MTESDSNIPQPTSDATENDGGWIKLHRGFLEKSIFKCPKLCQTWIFLLLNAKWADDVFSDGVVKIPLKRGQLVGTYSYLTKTLNRSKSDMQKILNRLRKGYAIDTERILGYTVITILNYNRYQCIKSEQGYGKDMERIWKGYGKDTERILSKEVKKLRSEEIKKEEIKNESSLYVNRQNEILPAPPKPKIKKSLPISEEDRALAEKWLGYAKEKIPSIKASPESYQEGIYRARIGANLSADQMVHIFNFISEDPFWASNAYSPCGLLKKSKNGLRKIDNIIASLRREKYSHIDLFEKIRLEEEQDARDALDGKVLTESEKMLRMLGIGI